MILFKVLLPVTLLIIRTSGQEKYSILETSDVYFQSFNLTGLEDRKNFYKNQILPILGDLKDAGIDGVWFPPASQGYIHKDGNYEDYYTPTEWFKFPHQWWLKRILNETKSLGMKVIMDVALNHRMGKMKKGCMSFSRPNWNSSTIVEGDADTKCSPGGEDSGRNKPNIPDLDHTNEMVQNDTVKYLQKLQRWFFVDSFRYDFASGYGAEITKLYNQMLEPSFSVGDLDGNKTKDIFEWVKNTGFTSAAFDNTMNTVLDTAMMLNDYGRMGRNSSELGMSESYNIVPNGLLALTNLSATFVDNHLTVRLDDWSPNTASHHIQGYAYILTHPGIPFIFVDHWMNSTVQAAIKELIKIRKEQNVTSNAPLYIEKHEKGLYAAYIGGGTNWPCRWFSSANYTEATVAVKLGSNDWKPAAEAGSWKLRYDDENVKIWTKDSTSCNGIFGCLGFWLHNYVAPKLYFPFAG